MGLYKCSTWLDLGCDADGRRASVYTIRGYSDQLEGRAVKYLVGIRKEEGRRRELEEVADASAGILQRVIGV